VYGVSAEVLAGMSRLVPHDPDRPGDVDGRKKKKNE
jgi:hypothetical protein